MSHVSPPLRRVPKKAAEKRKPKPTRKVRKEKKEAPRYGVSLEEARCKLAALECKAELLAAHIDGIQWLVGKLEREEEVTEVDSSEEED